MATLAENVAQAISDFDGVKAAITAKGVSVPEGTPTSRYGELVDEVYEAGKKQQYDAFWDTFQLNGNRTDYGFAFKCRDGQSFWSLDTFKPKYNIIASTAGGMFQYFQLPLDLTDYFEKLGLKLVFMEGGSYSQTFYGSKIVRIPEIRVKGTLSQTFTYAANLITIDKITLIGSCTFTGAFTNAVALENLTFEGEIASNGLNLQWSTLLTRESLLNIIACLADKSADTGGNQWVVTLGPENTAKLTDEELQIATDKGWVVI